MVERDLAGERYREVLEVFLSAYLGVEVFTEENDDERKKKSYDHGYEKYVAAGRGCGADAVRRGEHPGVIGGEGLRELVFLAFLEEVEVERLLDFLLPFD